MAGNPYGIHSADSEIGKEQWREANAWAKSHGLQVSFLDEPSWYHPQTRIVLFEPQH